MGWEGWRAFENERVYDFMNGMGRIAWDCDTNAARTIMSVYDTTKKGMQLKPPQSFSVRVSARSSPSP